MELIHGSGVCGMTDIASDFVVMVMVMQACPSPSPGCLARQSFVMMDAKIHVNITHKSLRRFGYKSEFSCFPYHQSAPNRPFDTMLPHESRISETFW